MNWKDLVQNAGQYGFLGPLVGVAGLFIGSGIAILFGWTKTFDAWKPPEDVLPEPLSRMVTMLCAIAIFVAWILAEPAKETGYIHAVIWLAGGGVLAFLLYVGLRTYCGRFRKPLVDSYGKPSRQFGADFGPLRQRRRRWKRVTHWKHSWQEISTTRELCGRPCRSRFRRCSERWYW